MKNSLLLIIVISLLCGCFKPVGTYNHISAAMNADFNFQQGSYWIYRDSLTGEMDSVAVSLHESGTNSTTPHDPTEAVHTDYIDIGLSNYPVAPAIQSSDTIYWLFNLYPGGLEITYTRYNPDRYPNILVGDGYMKFDAGDPFTTSNYGDSCGRFTSSVLSSITINNQVFSNVGYLTNQCVGCLRTGYSLPSMAYSDEVYICPKVGIVKLSVKHPLDSIYRVWELVRCKVKL